MCPFKSISFKWLKAMSFCLVVGACILSFGLSKTQAGTQGAADKSIEVSSGQQIYEPFQGRTSFDGDVKVAFDGTEVTGSHADIQMDKDGKPSAAVFPTRSKMIRQSGDKKTVIQADTMNMGLQNGALQAAGKVVTQMAGGDAKDKDGGDVAIQSDNQVFDQDKHIMRAVGHVTVKRGDLFVTSPEALVFMAAAGGVEKVLFINGVHLAQGQQQMDAESITVKLDTGDIYAEKNTKSIVDGKDSQGKPTKIKVSSYLQELDKQTGTLFANGNAIVYYDDYIAKGPKAVFYKVNNELDRIVLTGRAQIEDNERKVSGDTVTITVSPRQFHAQGNVTTFIKTNKQQQSQPATPANANNKTSKMASSAKQSQTSKSKTIASSVNKETPSPNPSPWDQEMMIEKATHGTGKPQ